MKALTWHGRGDIRCEEVPEPRIEEDPMRRDCRISNWPNCRITKWPLQTIVLGATKKCVTRYDEFTSIPVARPDSISALKGLLLSGPTLRHQRLLHAMP